MTVDTSPWGSSVLQAASGGFTHIHTLTLLADGLTTSWPLTPLQSTVTFNGRRSPYITATLVIAWPTADALSVLDPKAYTLSVKVLAGYKLGVGSGRDVQQLVTLRVIDVSRDYIAQTVTLLLASDEIIPTSHPAEVAYAYTTSDMVVTAIKAVIADSFPGTTLSWNTDAAPGDTFDSAQRIEVGEDRWDAVSDWAESIGCKVWHDGNGQWFIGILSPTAAGQAAAAMLKVGPTGQVSQLRVGDSLDGYANRVAVVYEAKSSTSAATITTSGAIASTGDNPPRGVTIQRRRKPHRPVANAKHALRRALRRGHSVDVTATAYLWVRPREVVTVSLPGGRQERLLVEVVTFQLHAGTMTLAGQSDSTGRAADAGAITVTTF